MEPAKTVEGQRGTRSQQRSNVPSMGWMVAVIVAEPALTPLTRDARSEVPTEYPLSFGCLEPNAAATFAKGRSGLDSATSYSPASTPPT